MRSSRRGERWKKWAAEHAVELLLFLLLWGTYGYFYQSTQHNEAARFDQMRAMVQDHTLSINKYWWNSADIIHYPKNGVDFVYPNKAPGGALLGVVPFAVITTVLQPLRWAGVPEWIYWHLVPYLFVVCTVSALSALAAVAMYRVLLQLGGDRLVAAASVLAVWLGTLAFPYSTLFFSHQLSASLLTLGFTLLCSWQLAAPNVIRRASLRFFAAGFLIGCSVLCEYPTALLAALLSFYALVVVMTRQAPRVEKISLLGAFAGGALITVIILVSYNLAAYGKWAYVPIEAYASPTSEFPTYTHGILGFQWNGWRHFVHALAAVTIYPKIGNLYIGVEHWVVYACSPVLWLCLPGLVALLWRRATRLLGILVLGMAVIYLLFITSYGTSEYDWAGGSYLGSRHLVPLFGFLALPLAALGRRWLPLLYPLLAISAFYMLLGTAVEPRVGYPSDNPHRDIFLPEFLRGHLAQNTAALFDGEHHLLTKDSTAFNLGKLARLPARYQLAPLMLWWLLVGGLLAIITSDRVPGGNAFVLPRARLRGLFVFVVLITLLPVIHHAAFAQRHQRSGLSAKYFRNSNWSGKPIETQIDPNVDFDWSKTFPLQPPFSVEWSGGITIELAGPYTFSVVADDGASVEIDGRMVADALHAVLQKKSGSVTLSKGTHAIRVRYVNELFGGSVKLTYIAPGRGETIVPSTVLIPKLPTSEPR